MDINRLSNSEHKGWAYILIKDVICKIPLTGKKIKQNEYKITGKVPIVDQGQSFIGGYTDNEAKKIAVKEPLIIFGDHTKIIKYVNFDFVPGADGIKVIKPFDIYYPKFFYYFLQSTKILNKGYSRHFQFVEKSLIPLLSTNEQYRIVEKIEELFTKLDAGVAALEKVRAQLKRYRQAVLKAAFSGQLTAEWRQKCVGAGSSRPLEASKTSDSDKDATTQQNGNLPDLPAGWEWKNGKNIFDFVTSGSRGWAKYYSDTGSIFLRMGNLDHNSISLDLRNIQHVQLPKGIEGIRTKVEANDILISITADVGMIALIPENFDEAYINQHIALCRPNKEVFQKYVAWYLVCHEGGLKQFQNMRRGATKIGLGLDDIRIMKIPITKKDEQHQIVSEIERRFSVADEVEKTVENALRQARRLRQSILKRAFEGKLVPQDPNDEPAEKLLERIKAEKELHKKKKRMI
ncbi:MAG: restriction endonuclease subunit S [Candidatus Aminicenantes bacterium]|nr:restriction endonuclease subunit S [Candidatus Aminicenantes bacterium]